MFHNLLFLLAGSHFINRRLYTYNKLIKVIYFGAYVAWIGTPSDINTHLLCDFSEP